MSIKSIQVQIGADTLELQTALKNVKKEFKDLGKELRLANQKMRFDDSNISNYTKKIEKLKEKQKEYQKQLDLIAQAQKNVEKSDLSADDKEEKLRRLNYEAERTGLSLQQLAKEIKQLEDAKIKLEIDQSRMGQISSSLKNVSEKAGGLASKFKFASLGAAGALAAFTKSAFDFDDAFADVTKTVDGTKEQLDGLKTEILEMSKTQPTSPETLSQIMSLGGQFGIARENLAEFTKSVSLLEVATNLTAEEAATMIAQFSNVTGMPISEVENFSSALVNLGNNTATTEKAIMEMASRVSGTAALYGFDEQEILAVSAALSSVGISAEAGGTSISKTMTLMGQTVAEGGQKLQDFAKHSGVNAQEFADAWKKEPIVAFEMFFKSLNKLQSEGKNLDTVLKEMGINEVRMSESIKKMAKNPELLAKSLKVSSDGWKENVALTNEAENKFASFQNSLKIIMNDIRVTFLQTFEKIAPSVKSAIEVIANAIKGLMKMIGNLPTGAIKALTLGLVGLAGAAPTFKLISVGANLASKATGKLAEAFYKLNATGITKSNWGDGIGNFVTKLKGFGPATLAISSAIVVLKGAYDSANKYSKALSDAHNESMKKFSLNDDDSANAFNSLTRSISDFRSELRLAQADTGEFNLKDITGDSVEKLEDTKKAYADLMSDRLKKQQEVYASSKLLNDSEKDSAIANLKDKYAGAEKEAHTIFNKIAQIQGNAAKEGRSLTAAEIKQIEGLYSQLETHIQGLDMRPKSEGEQLLANAQSGFKLNAEEQTKALAAVRQSFTDEFAKIQTMLDDGTIDSSKAQAKLQQANDEIIQKIALLTGELPEEIQKGFNFEINSNGAERVWQTEGQKQYQAFQEYTENVKLRMREGGEQIAFESQAIVDKQKQAFEQSTEIDFESLDITGKALQIVERNKELFSQIDFSQDVNAIKAQIQTLYNSDETTDTNKNILNSFFQAWQNTKSKLSEINLNGEAAKLQQEGAKLPRGIEKGANTTPINFTPLSNSIKTSLPDNSADARQKGANVSRSYSGGIDSQLPSVNSSAKKMAQAVKDNAKTDLHSNGVNIVSGFVSGLSSMLGSVASIASQIASTVDAAIRKKNEIKSPSRLMMRLGGYITEGFAIGIEEEIPKVQVAVAKMQKTITAPMVKEAITWRIGLNQAAIYKEAMTKALSQATSKQEYDFIKDYWDNIIKESEKQSARAIEIQKLETKYDAQIAKLKATQSQKEKHRDNTKNKQVKNAFQRQINNLEKEQKRLEQIKQIEIERVKSQHETADLMKKMNDELSKAIDKTKQMAIESMNKALSMILDNNVLEKSLNKLNDLNTYVSTAPIDTTMQTIANTSNNNTTNNSIVINVQGGDNQDENKLAEAIVNVLNKKGVVV